MVKMCSRVIPYVCKECNQDTLFFVTANNKLIDYKLLIDYGMNAEEVRNFIIQKRVTHMICMNCNKTYALNLVHPFPENINMKTVLDNFLK